MKVKGKIFGFLKAIITRLVFILHGFFAIFLVVQNKDDSQYWWPVVFLLLLVLESLFTLLVRKGQEYRYFWPSCFLYIMSVLPCIWEMELDLLEERTNNINNNMNNNINTTMATSTNEAVWQKLSKRVIAEKVGALGLTIAIIIGRWLLPRGKITRDQLSALLIGYVGIAADILEVFNLFGEENLKHDKNMVKATLVVFSWCLISFCFVTTATTGNDESKSKVVPSGMTPAMGNPSLVNEYINKIEEKRRKDTLDLNCRKDRVQKYKTGPPGKITPIKSTLDNIPKRQFDLHGDVYGICTGLLMMDGPFLIFRLYCTVQYSVYSEMHLFYLTKNAISLVLLVYRLSVLVCKDFEYSGEDDFYKQTDEDKLRNIQIAVVGCNNMRQNDYRK